MKRLFLLPFFFVMLMLTSLAALADPIQGGDKDTVWMRYTNSTAYWVQISHTNKYIAKGGGGTSFYDFNTGSLLKTFGGSAQGFFINNDNQFIRINQTGTGIDIIDLNSWQVADSMKMGDKTLRANAIANVSQDGHFFIGEVEGGLNVWDITTRKAVFFLPVKSNDQYLTELQYAGIYINCDDTKAYVHIWKVFKPDNNPVHDYIQKYIIEYNLQSGDSINTYVAGNGSWLSNACQFYATNISATDQGIQVYNLATKQLLWTLPTNGYTVTDMEFSPDDKYLFTSHGPGASVLNVWDVTNGNVIYQYRWSLNNLEGPYDNMDLSDDGKYVAACSDVLMFLYRTDGINGVIDPKNSSETLYPNPTNNQINLIFTTTSPDIVNILVTNETGKTVKQLYNGFLKEGAQKLSYDVSGLIASAYFVTISSKNYNKIFKLIINK